MMTFLKDIGVGPFGAIAVPGKAAALALFGAKSAVFKTTNEEIC
jgi:hypothetical protein